MNSQFVNAKGIIAFKEDIKSDIDGSIIDIETSTNDNLHNRALDYSIQRYNGIEQLIFGVLDNSSIHIYCVTSLDYIAKLDSIFNDRMKMLTRPFYAFNIEFESGVWYCKYKTKILFDGELQKFKYESKKQAINELVISNYDDPFYDRGLECYKAWLKKEYQQAIKHNRACLLKERDILQKRGYRNPEYQIPELK